MSEDNTQQVFDMSEVKPTTAARLRNLLADDGDLRVGVGMDFADDFHTKFIKGAAEHGGVLTHKPVLREAWNEVLDLVAYLGALKDQHAAVGMICRDMEIGELTAEEGTRLIKTILHLT